MYAPCMTVLLIVATAYELFLWSLSLTSCLPLCVCAITAMPAFLLGLLSLYLLSDRVLLNVLVLSVAVAVVQGCC